MDISRSSVVVIGAPGRLRDGLLLMLSSYASLEVIGLAEERLGAQKILTGRPVDLVLLHADVSDGDALLLLKELKRQWPQTGCLFIGGSARQLKAARDEGAEAVLMRGFQIGDLSTAIDGVLRGRAMTHESPSWHETESRDGPKPTARS